MTAETKLLDWTDVKGADDFLAKSESDAASAEAAKERVIKSYVGNPEDSYSNAGLIRELAELMIEDPGYYTRPLETTKMLEPRQSPLDPYIPRERGIREKLMEVNQEAMEFLHEYFGAVESSATQEINQDEDGFTHVETITPSKQGFYFREVKVYFPGHDLGSDALPDNFYAEVSSISDKDKGKAGSYRLPPDWHDMSGLNNR